MEAIKHFVYVINLRTIVISIVSVIATFFCGYFSFTCEMPASLIGIAVVFPLVFTINASFQRRDQALNEYGVLNSQLVSLYLAHKIHLSKDLDIHYSEEIRISIMHLLKTVEDDLTNEKNCLQRKAKIYKSFEEISRKNKRFLDKSLHDMHVFACNCLNQIMQSYEILSKISEYRTPKGLRAYSKVFLNLFPIIFAPYFASFNGELVFIGYLIAVLYSFVLSMLSTIQDNVENPFDNKGLDDINFTSDNRFLNLNEPS
ncbi:MAG: hypothetical protein CMC43_05880 [Flavobacteriaceae bacterium]|nr:hypothetical protein [Flavobacteriaceae bacterium]